MAWQSRDETWKEMVYNPESSQTKSLSTKLKEMGFDENTFVVVKKYDNIKVSDHYGSNGQLEENPYMSFGGEHRDPRDSARRTDFERYNDEMMKSSPDGKIAVGMVGSNNGVYAAKVFQGDEMIITKDPQITWALQRELGFADGMGVPLSNGGVIMDYDKRKQFDNMAWACARKADREGQELRTAAVQRGDIITTYDPNNMSPDGLYRNVRNYEKQKDGSLRSIDYAEVSHKLGLDMQHESLTKASIDTGQKLDGAAVNKMLADKWINYSGR